MLEYPSTVSGATWLCDEKRSRRRDGRLITRPPRAEKETSAPAKRSAALTLCCCDSRHTHYRPGGIIPLFFCALRYLGAGSVFETNGRQAHLSRLGQMLVPYREP